MKSSSEPLCGEISHEASERRKPSVSAEILERTAALFAALGDPPRLRLLTILAQGPACVSELAADEDSTMSAVSQRLKILHAASLVTRRRQGKHIVYSLSDQHVADLVFSALAHTGGPPVQALQEGVPHMSEHHIHASHDHVHGPDCGHTAVKHDGHTDYLHDGHLHHAHDGHYDEHTIAVTTTNPAECTPEHVCSGHEAGHVHGPNCGHEAVPHGDHVDYLVDGHLHHPHEGHCDNHGPLAVV